MEMALLPCKVDHPEHQHSVVSKSSERPGIPPSPSPALPPAMRESRWSGKLVQYSLPGKLFLSYEFPTILTHTAL